VVNDTPLVRVCIPSISVFIQHTTHLIKLFEEEKRSFVEHINKLLRDEPDLKGELETVLTAKLQFFPRFFLILLSPPRCASNRSKHK